MTGYTYSARARRLARRPPYAILIAAALLTIMPANADDGANPRGNIERAIRQIEAVTGETVTNPFKTELGDDPKTHCVENGFCEGRIGELRIEAMGRQIEITPAPKTPSELLVGSCIGLLHAFAGKASATDATNAVQGAFEQVLDGRVATLESEAFQFKMKLNGEDLPSCKLVRFVQR